MSNSVTAYRVCSDWKPAEAAVAFNKGYATHISASANFTVDKGELRLECMYGKWTLFKSDCAGVIDYDSATTLDLNNVETKRKVAKLVSCVTDTEVKQKFDSYLNAPQPPQQSGGWDKI